MKFSKVSVVIATHNGSRYLADAIGSVVNQGSLVECIVVIDGSTDNSHKIASQFDCKVISLESNVGLSAARNIGWRHASSGVVAFIDDDVVLPGYWLERFIEAWNLAPASAVGIGGVVEPYDSKSLSQNLALLRIPLQPLFYSTKYNLTVRFKGYLLRFQDSRLQKATFVESFVGANMSYLKFALEHVQGFDDSIKFGGDETELSKRIRNQFGFDALWFDPAVVVFHQFLPQLGDFFRRSYAYGKGSGRAFARGKGGISTMPGAVFTLVLGFVSLIFAQNLLLAATTSTATYALLQFGSIRRAIKVGRPTLMLLWPLLFVEEVVNNFGFLFGAIEGRKGK